MSNECAAGWTPRSDVADTVAAAALHHVLWTLECGYWADVDFNGARTAAEFYSEDAVFDVGLPGARMEGKPAIAAFYAGRHSQGPRTSLHLVSNFALVEWTPQSARTRAVVSLIANDGEPPRPAMMPLLVTSAETSYAYIDGLWKVTARINAPQFVDSHSGLDKRIASARESRSESAT